MTAMFSLEICVRLYQAQKRVQDRDLDSLGDSSGTDTVTCDIQGRKSDREMLDGCIGCNK